MKCLSIRAPWAWLIVNGYKDIENRDWPTHFRGRFLVHTGKRYDDDIAPAINIFKKLYPKQKVPIDFDLGGIIGAVDIVGCVDKHDSPWFFGKFGFVLANPQPLPFVELRGKLGLFNVPDEFVNAHYGKLL